MAKVSETQRHDYIVLRGTGSVYWEGWWFDRMRTPEQKRRDERDRRASYRLDVARREFGPTGEYESRADGEQAEVYRPLDALEQEVEK